MLDWLIIGGGIQGTAVSHSLLRRNKISPGRLRVLDPYDMPLARWHATTQNTGMTHLRSPEVHHLHYDPWSIRTFAQTKQGKLLADYIPIFSRPSLGLFNAYSDWLIDKYDLSALRLTGRANGLSYDGTCWHIETDNGHLTTKNVILAINTTESPHWPEWAKTLKGGNAPINHIFDLDFVRADLPVWQHTVIIGGGISAVQTALALASQHPGTVTLLSRHEMRLSHFDSDPCWVTNICLRDFHKITDFDKRREVITQARQPGSIPPDVAEALQSTLNTGAVKHRVSKVTQATYQQGGITLHLNDGNTIETDQIILATGFEASRPGGEWLSNTIDHLGLPIADCGYPVVDKHLCWVDGLYVVGRLAELEIGPVAANIIGARLATERLKTIK